MNDNYYVCLYSSEQDSRACRVSPENYFNFQTNPYYYQVFLSKVDISDDVTTVTLPSFDLVPMTWHCLRELLVSSNKIRFILF